MPTPSLKTLALAAVLTAGALALLPAPAAAGCQCVAHQTVVGSVQRTPVPGEPDPCPEMKQELFDHLDPLVSCPGQFCEEPHMVYRIGCSIFGRSGNWMVQGQLKWGCYEGNSCS